MSELGYGFEAAAEYFTKIGFNWQPIETAPQDGETKLILGSWNGRGEETVAILALEPQNSTQGDTTRPRAIFGMGAIFYPTHWMPLPPPPPPRPGAI